MFKKLFGIGNAADAAPKKTSSYDPEKLRMLAMHFPVGRKLRYYPEYHREAILNTIVIGYRVNDHYFYSNDQIATDEPGNLRGFKLASGKLLGAEDIDRFMILVPDTSDQIRQLDYLTRAELGKAGPFRQGNIITLVAMTTERCIPTLDTTVFRRLELKEGPYAGSEVVLLEPDMSSLAIADKRKHQRVQSSVAALLHYGCEAEKCLEGTLHDFAEDSLRINFITTDPPPQLKVGETVFVEFVVSADELPCRLQGRVIRQDEESAVVRTEQIFVDGTFRKLRMMDVVEIKSALLNRSAAGA